MADVENSTFLSQKRYAVVTGSNKGLGFETCKQLASKGVMVILTARNEKRGIEAIDKLIKNYGVDPNNLAFHQLDVTDPATISSLANFITSKFGKLDILVNNAGISGVTADFDAIKTIVLGKNSDAQINHSNFAAHTYEQVVECCDTNYYGVKRTIEALLPLLQLSNSPRIVNVSSSAGKLENIPSEGIRETLNNIENLTYEKIDDIINEFKKDFKNDLMKDWRSFYPAYTMSKAALNSYSRILAKKNPSIIINCLCPGYIKTDFNENTGIVPIEEGGTSCVQLALLPHNAPSGLFFYQNQVSSFV